MTDDRPAPQYGEYATPQQQAAAMGREYVPPAPPMASTPQQATVSPEEHAPTLGHLIDRFATMLQLGIGLLSLITSNWFQYAVTTNQALAKAGISTRIPTAVDRYGLVVLGANFVFLALTFLWAYTALRRGRWAFYIPFVGLCGFGIAAGIVTYAVTR